MKRLVAVVCLLALTAGCLGALGDPVEQGTAGDGSADGTASDDPAANGTLAVHYIDVGQADATFVRGPSGETMLIDAGGWQDDGEIVIAYLEDRGVERLDHLVTTHPHADHIGGAAAVIEHFETEGEGVGAVWDSGVAHTSQTYERYLDAIETYHVTLHPTQAGDEIPLNGTTATVLNPPAEPDGDEFHPNSVAVRIRHGESAFLFTGDAERPTEDRVREQWNGGLRSTVLQAGHHGSDTSNGRPFLDAVEPRVAVVSSDHDSQYGHPHNETLARAADRGIDVYWTGVHGTVVAESNGTAVTVSTAVDATTDPTALRDAPAAEAAATADVEARATYDATADVPTAAAVSRTAGAAAVATTVDPAAPVVAPDALAAAAIGGVAG